MNGEQEGTDTTGEETEEGFYDDEFAELEQEWSALSTERDSLRAELARVNGELASLRSELESARAAGEPAGEPAASIITTEEAVPQEAVIIEPESSHWLYHKLWGNR